MLSREDAIKAGLYCQWWFTPCTLCKQYNLETEYCNYFSYIPNPQKTYCRWFQNKDQQNCGVCEHYADGKCYKCCWLVNEQDEPCYHFQRKHECACNKQD